MPDIERFQNLMFQWVAERDRQTAEIREVVGLTGQFVESIARMIPPCLADPGSD
jgi:hypothetical protein